MYTEDQISKYLDHIGWSRWTSNADTGPPGSLPFLRRLMTLQLATVPFESLTLHYSKFHLLSLDLQDLYHKIVERGMGGYCMENNTFFGAVLRSLGYTVLSAGARVSDATAGRPGGGYKGWYVIQTSQLQGQKWDDADKAYSG